MINRILQQQRLYIKAYVDNIVIFFNMLKEYLNHLYNIFNVLDRLSVQVAYRSCESELNSGIELSWANFYSAESGAG